MESFKEVVGVPKKEIHDLIYNDIISDIAGNLFICRYIFEGGRRTTLKIEPIDHSVPIHITEE
jgi:hypothetical protein